MTKRRLMLVRLAIAALVIAIAVRYLVVDRSVQHGLSRLDVRKDRIFRVEVFEQDHCCGGPKTELITLPQEMHSPVLSALHQIDWSSVDGGCKCGTSGTQILIHMRGEPSVAQVSCTGCGDFVLHDGNGGVHSYFRSKVLRAWIDKHYWSLKKKDKIAEPVAAGDAAGPPP
ncbi:MAG: hypothetical protein GY851_34100 [bacterium]|nr:hypothetical protein [bacterium]